MERLCLIPSLAHLETLRWESMHSSSFRFTWTLVLLAMSLILGACDALEDPIAQPRPSPPAVDSSPVPSQRSAATPDPLSPPSSDSLGAPGSGTPSDEPHGDSQCSAAEVTGIDGAIGSQLTAFAEGDFEAAFKYASEDFQSSTEVGQFEDLIIAEYPELLDAMDHEVAVCVRTPSGAQALVKIVAAVGSSVDLAYLLVIEADGWRIAGAQKVATDSPPVSA